MLHGKWFIVENKVFYNNSQTRAYDTTNNIRPLS